MQRSGTNWVYDLVSSTGLYSSIGPIWENNLLSSWPAFSDAATNWVGRWPETWAAGDKKLLKRDLRSKLESELFSGVLEFLKSESSDRNLPIATKCPIARGSVVSDEILEKIKVVFLVRNPIHLIQSGMTAFGWSLFGAVEAFNDATEDAQFWISKDGVLVMQFENLKEAWGQEADRIFDFLEVPPESRRLAPLPVRGQTLSSGVVASWSQRNQDSLAVSEKLRLNVFQRWFLASATAKSAEFWGYSTCASETSIQIALLLLNLRTSLKRLTKRFISLR